MKSEVSRFSRDIDCSASEWKSGHSFCVSHSIFTSWQISSAVLPIHSCGMCQSVRFSFFFGFSHPLLMSCAVAFCALIGSVHRPVRNALCDSAVNSQTCCSSIDVLPLLFLVDSEIPCSYEFSAFPLVIIPCSFLSSCFCSQFLACFPWGICEPCWLIGCMVMASSAFTS